MNKPILFLANAQHALRRGPVGAIAGPSTGNVWTIMARPRIRFGEGGHGRCWPFVPETLDLFAVRSAVNALRTRERVLLEEMRSAEERERDVTAVGDTHTGAMARLNDVRRGQIEALDHYRDAFLSGPARWCDGEAGVNHRKAHPQIAPGKLFAQPHRQREVLWPVHHGDTLICACAAAAAKAGKCHRVFAAALLVDAGWRVILDGEEVHREAPPSSTPAVCSDR